jgi:hypothetical protein
VEGRRLDVDLVVRLRVPQQPVVGGSIQADVLADQLGLHDL